MAFSRFGLQIATFAATCFLLHPSLFAEVVVRWDVFPAPVLNTDYTVNAAVEPPNVQLVTKELPDGTAVATWFIGRHDGAGNALDLGDITTAWGGVTSHDIRVLVGTLVDAPCRHLRYIKIDRQSANNWSSVVLNLTGDLVFEAVAQASTGGQGGCLSGTIAGNAHVLNAHAVCDGPGVGATLNVLGDVTESGAVNLQTIPAGSTLSTQNLKGGLLITGDVAGELTLKSVTRAGDVERHFSVMGDVTGSITIGDAISGGLEGRAINVAGTIGGPITV